MDSATDHEITRIFQEFANDRPGLWRELMPHVQTEIKRIVSALLGKSRRQPSEITSVVQEVFLKMKDYERLGSNRVQFFANVAAAVRFILIDRARKRESEKGRREGKRKALLIHVPTENAEIGQFDIEALEKALRAMQESGKRAAKWFQVITLYWFGGLMDHEVADVLGISLKTVYNYKQHGLAFLRADLSRTETR